MNQDLIHINDLRVQAIIGVYPQERILEQEVVINITLYTSHAAPGESDRLEDAVDYHTLTNRVADLAQTAQCGLVERLASEIARLCLQDRRVTRAVVRVEKPQAIAITRSVGITVDRVQGDF